MGYISEFVFPVLCNKEYLGKFKKEEIDNSMWLSYRIYIEENIFNNVL